MEGFHYGCGFHIILVLIYFTYLLFLCCAVKREARKSDFFSAIQSPLMNVQLDLEQHAISYKGLADGRFLIESK